jgi:hypothetical protein
VVENLIIKFLLLMIEIVATRKLAIKKGHDRMFGNGKLCGN